MAKKPLKFDLFWLYIHRYFVTFNN